jgi:uncharacterized protein YukE
MGFFGLDVLAIRHLARQLDQQSQEVEAAIRELTEVIKSTEWYGVDSNRFLEQWQATRVPELRRAANLLKEASQLATRGAAKQEQISRS